MPPVLSPAGRRVPDPLGYAKAIERALELRAEEGLSYRAIAVVMRRYHGVDRKHGWWLKRCRAAGSAPKFHGSQEPLVRARPLHMFPIDRAVLEALTDCPLTVLQLRYRLGGKLDRFDRSLGRLVELGKVEGSGHGLERKWRAR